MNSLNKLKVPGIVWSALLIAAAALIQENVSNPLYYQLAMGAVALLLKGQDVGFAKILAELGIGSKPVNSAPIGDTPTARSLGPADEEAAPEPSALSRFLLG